MWSNKISALSGLGAQLLCVVGAVLAICLLPMICVAQPVTGKKLIEFGGDEPSPAFMRRHSRQMDRIGFDGVVFYIDPIISGNVVNFAVESWGQRRFEYGDFAQNIADLRACRFKHLKHNFLRFNVTPGDVDWFDEVAFGNVVNNARLAARLVHETGNEGIMFDVEQYAVRLFSYEEQGRRFRNHRSFDDYEAMVKQRGREFIGAINVEFPDITILLPYAYEITGLRSDRAREPYGLFKSFLDGMFEAASEQTRLVHAYETAYPFRQYQQFVDAYKFVREELAKASSVPDRYLQRVQVGFGIWLDYGYRRYGWNERDFERNYFTPAEFGYAVSSALKVADEYVWIYSESPHWWPPTRVPAAYLTQLRRAQAVEAKIDDSRFANRFVKGDEVRAIDQVGYSEDTTFRELQEQWTIVDKLPVRWRFRIDPAGKGERLAWFGFGKGRQGWDDIEIGHFWDEQRGPYIGSAWYRLDWMVPAYKLPTDTRIALLFGAADETAKVWINGVLVGQHDQGPDGWNRPFAIDITEAIRLGKVNTLAVKVTNTVAVGGLWKRIKVGTRREAQAK